ncbi:MAG: ATP phosphoribosyltransferase regulatory subunit, partial [Haliea sp.]|nr:ATP phosphoribosyltransferase regulatory subunit [Haliea sp.]
VYFDLAELRGYHYHTGMVFAAYAPGHGQALANGGRYNDVGKVFGRARPATGFATDLKALMALVPAAASERGAVSAADVDDPALLAAIAALRTAGEVVIRCSGGKPDARCDRTLIQADGEWVLRPLNS